MIDILMPKLSESTEQGTIISWFKSTGDRVELGEELLEIETDKAIAPYVAETSGVLEVLVPVGATIAVGEPIGRIGTEADVSASAGRGRDAPNGSGSTGVAASGPLASASGAPPVAQGAVAAATNGNGELGADAPRATPLARRSAAVYGVALEGVPGTGPLGRITRADVLSAAGVALPAQRPAPERHAPALTPQRPQAPSSSASHQALSRVQQLIATRMSESKSTVPHFQVQTEVDMHAPLALREELKTLVKETEAVPSINDIIVKASAIALRNHPLANGSYKEGAFELHEAINVGVAVATNDALIVPTVFNADTKSLGQVALDTRRLASAVRDGSIAPKDLEGATFTVSNLGMFGMTAIIPVINPPQAAILGVGALRPTLARVDGEIVDRPLLTLTLSCDHRILYGADAARFLAYIRELLEAPVRLAL